MEPQFVRAPETFEWKKTSFRHRWKLVSGNDKIIATASFSWIISFKGTGSYDGKVFEVFERGKPEYGVYLKRQDDLEYWGRFEPSYDNNGVKFVLRNRQQYSIVTSERGTFDLFDPRGMIIGKTKFSVTKLRKSEFTLLRSSSEELEPSLLAIVSLIVAYRETVGNLILALGTGATSGV